MEINELRIGNYILYPKYWKDTPIRVTGVSVVDRRDDHTGIYEEFLALFEKDFANKDNFDQFVDYKQGVICPKDASPIPLTEDWLLRFGFEKISNAPAPHFSYRKPIALNWKKEPSCYFRVVDFEYSATGEHWRGWLLPLTDGEYFMSQKNVEIEHVHQLQNLYFALTGKELEIK